MILVEKVLAHHVAPSLWITELAARKCLRAPLIGIGEVRTLRWSQCAGARGRGMGLVVKRWQRRGFDRLYVNDAETQQRVAIYDRKTGKFTWDDEGDRVP